MDSTLLLYNEQILQVISVKSMFAYSNQAKSSECSLFQGDNDLVTFFFPPSHPFLWKVVCILLLCELHCSKIMFVWEGEMEGEEGERE